MREDDRLLDEAAADAMRGDLTYSDYRQVWRAVMDERAREMAGVCSDQACGHAWADGQRHWAAGRPTSAISCRQCVAAAAADELVTTVLVPTGA